MKNITQLSWLLVIVLAVGSIAFGQAPTGSVSGTVYDESGAVIANALVVVKNKATGAERRLSSGADGVFTAPAL
ncbi:MAG: carboxypeptidase-like regulatory domain-containing protein, partial [Bryobacteraceae bacterium]